MKLCTFSQVNEEALFIWFIMNAPLPPTSASSIHVPLWALPCDLSSVEILWSI